CATFSLLTLLCVEFFEHRVLADYGPPIAAASPLICPWWAPNYRLLMLLPRSRVCHGSPVRPPNCDAVSIATLCHVPLSGLLTLLVVPFLS
ncbi:unnamed protein product, partial [Staurois parvus]